MTQAQPRFFTFEEYLSYDDGTEIRYELVNGELVAMPTENDENALIASLLFAMFLQVGVLPHLLRVNSTEIAVSGSRATCRKPDLLLLTEDAAAALKGGKGVITFDMPSPQLVVEIVSPGHENQMRDYRHKRSEYAARSIPEYWIVDPIAQLVTVLVWIDGLYEAREFRGENPIISPTLPTFCFSTTQIFQ